MTAVWMQVRSVSRRQWRASVSLAMLIALGGGAVTAAAAGARRTESVYGRLVTATFASHAVVAAEFGADGYTVEELIAMPEVAAVRRVGLYLMTRGPLETCGEECLIVGAAYGPEVGGAVDVGKVVRGRRPDPSDPTEVALTVIGDQDTPLRVGDRFPLAGVPFPEPFFEPFARAATERPLELEVVGVVALSQDFPPQLGDETIHLQLTPAFLERYDVPAFGVDDAATVRLRAADLLGSFRTRILREGREGSFVFDRVSHGANVQRSMHLQALALWLLAAFAGLAFALILTQAIAREVWRSAGDHALLAALGMSRSALALISILRAATIGTLGAALGAGVAIALSPLMPIGLARVAEPSPGFATDRAVLALGAAAALGVPMLAAIVPSVRAAHASMRAGDAGTRRVSSAGVLAARAGRSVPVTVGVQMALEPGHGRSAVPVRSTIAAVAVGVGALVVALTFGGSLHRLVTEPELHGVPWDLSIVSEQAIDFATEADRLVAMPEVAGLSYGASFDLSLFVGDQEVEGIALDPFAGNVVPPVVEGRAPAPADATLEVVFGTATLRRLGVDVGDRLEVELPEIGSLDATVVGRGVVPTGDDVSAIGDAAWVSFEGLLSAAGVPADAPEARASRVYIELAPGADPDVVIADLANRYGVTTDDDLYLPPVGTPGDLVSFGRVRGLPFIVAGLVALVAAGALAHTLITAIRRRRGEVAVLKTLGFTRGQARRTIAVQATVVAFIGSAVGIPLGVAAGRWAWVAFAEGQGVIPAPVTPVVAIAIVAPAALVLANLIAALPARSAARTQPAVVLRTE